MSPKEVEDWISELLRSRSVDELRGAMTRVDKLIDEGRLDPLDAGRIRKICGRMLANGKTPHQEGHSEYASAVPQQRGPFRTRGELVMQFQREADHAIAVAATTPDATVERQWDAIAQSYVELVEATEKEDPEAPIGDRYVPHRCSNPKCLSFWWELASTAHDRAVRNEPLPKRLCKHCENEA